jgi:Arc/MetJ-type ribon-helix-helix transcriptional regulator
MEITITGPMEAFIQRQITEGYRDAEEVTRQALLRWMAEEADTPPRIQERLDEAARGLFKAGDRNNIERIIAAG